MGRSEKAKGYRGEAEFAKMVNGRRVPLSGAAPGNPGDIVWPGVGLGEVKRRADGFRFLYSALQHDQASGTFGLDFLAARADRRPWLVVLPYQVAARSLAGPGAGEFCREVCNARDCQDCQLARFLDWVEMGGYCAGRTGER